MTGSVRGFVSRFSEYVSTEFNNNQLTNLHCIIHQEALCVKSMTLNSTLKCVNGVILFIRSRALNHRQFRELLELSDNSCEDVLYHTAVRWLSQGETSRRVLQLRKEIIEFYSAKQKSCPLNNGDFLTSLALLVDILSHVNTLNRSLQGKEMTVCILYEKVRDFKDKFRLLKHQIQQKNYFHFHYLTELLTNKEIQEDQIPTSLILEVFEDILNDFSDRFQDFEKISPILLYVLLPSPTLWKLRLLLYMYRWNL